MNSDEILARAAQLEAKRTLAERARKLAAPLATGAPAGDPHVAFSVARERYLVHAAAVVAIMRLPSLVRLPGAQSPVVGLTRFRGDVLTLVDLRPLVGGASSALDDLGYAVVVGDDGPAFGILADRVVDAVHLAHDALLPPPAHRTGELPEDAGLVRAMTKDGGLVLDAARLVARQLRSAPRF